MKNSVKRRFIKDKDYQQAKEWFLSLSDNDRPVALMLVALDLGANSRGLAIRERLTDVALIRRLRGIIELQLVIMDRLAPTDFREKPEHTRNDDTLVSVLEAIAAHHGIYGSLSDAFDRTKMRLV